MQTLQQYFERTDTPAAGSPVGTVMVKVLAKNPGLDFEAARAEAHSLLTKAAGSRVYRTPRVLSPDEQVAQREQLKKAFGRSRPAQDAA